MFEKVGTRSAVESLTAELSFEYLNAKLFSKDVLLLLENPSRTRNCFQVPARIRRELENTSNSGRDLKTISIRELYFWVFESNQKCFSSPGPDLSIPRKHFSPSLYFWVSELLALGFPDEIVKPTRPRKHFNRSRKTDGRDNRFYPQPYHPSDIKQL